MTLDPVPGTHFAQEAFKGSWQRHNGHAWQYRLYDEAARMALVRHEFPEYLKAYLALPGDAGRIEYFR